MINLLSLHSPQVMVANAGIIIPKPMMDTDLGEFSLILNVRKIPKTSKRSQTGRNTNGLGQRDGDIHLLPRGR